MADALCPRSALATETSETTAGPGGAIGVVLRERHATLASLAAFRGREAELATAVQAAFGIALPATPKRVAAGDVAFVWAGPGKWLAEARRTVDFGALPAAVADQSDGRAVLRVSGPAAREALAALIPIDLHPRAFAPGDAALTHAATIAVHLWQVDADPAYDIAVFRSYAGTLWRWLKEASRFRGVDARIEG